MKNKTAAIIGASGLIGGHIFAQLLTEQEFTKIKLLVRKPLNLNQPKVEEIVIDFSDLAHFKSAISGSNAVFCSIGTTNNKVKGNKNEYRKVDFDIPVNAARFSAECGVQQFLLVSSVGADAKSNNFYLQLKGEAEEAVRQFPIPSAAIFRPSMLLGNRKEFRLGEKIGKMMMAPLRFLFPANFKPIQAANVAKAMINAAKKMESGTKIYHFSQMMKLCKENQ